MTDTDICSDPAICPVCHCDLDIHEEGGHPLHPDPCAICQAAEMTEGEKVAAFGK